MYSMNKDDAIQLKYMLRAIEQLEHYTRGMSESEFASRPMVQDAVARQVDIVGEAARKISPEFQALHPKIHWTKTLEIHDRIVGEDFRLNLALVWNTIQDDFPLLKQAIRKLLLG
jgi:uncharacterized protein with HEPN domain